MGAFKDMDIKNMENPEEEMRDHYDFDKMVARKNPYISRLKDKSTSEGIELNEALVNSPPIA